MKPSPPQAHSPLFRNNRANSLSFFVTPVQIQSPSPYINQALLVNSFSKISIFFSCCPWSKVCMIVAFPAHLLICLFPVTCFKLPLTGTFFDFPRRFELSGVDCTICSKYILHSPKNDHPHGFPNIDTAVAICRQHQPLNNKEKELYSTANDPRPRPQVIPNMDRKWSPTETASDSQMNRK